MLEQEQTASAECVEISGEQLRPWRQPGEENEKNKRGDQKVEAELRTLQAPSNKVQSLQAQGNCLSRLRKYGYLMGSSMWWSWARCPLT